VTYLHLAQFRLEDATRLVQGTATAGGGDAGGRGGVTVATLALEDRMWVLKHTPQQPRSLSDFFRRLERGLGPCHGCDAKLSAERVSLARPVPRCVPFWTR
jgi:hypothetical protein